MLSGNNKNSSDLHFYRTAVEVCRHDPLTFFQITSEKRERVMCHSLSALWALEVAVGG